MEPYDKTIMRLLPGDTPRQKFLYFKKMADILHQVGFSTFAKINGELLSQVVEEAFKREDLIKIKEH